MAAPLPRFVITGPPGAGKTPLIAELRRRGFGAVAEPARAVIAANPPLDGVPIYRRDRGLFWQLMFDRALEDFVRVGRDTEAAGPEAVATFFDRGIPDLVGYAELFGGADASMANEASRRHRYADIVFDLPSWPEIYVTDEDRTMTVEHAAAFGRHVTMVYADLGYTLVDVPKLPIEARADFVLHTLRQASVRV